ncbi:MAG TPA: hypothetical protein VK849_10375 [Longimicrobiales bacterium]|nr:hypothetical protein [Longimicrobiales bacterium]
MNVARRGWSQAALTTLALSACGGSLANRGSIEATIGRATYHDILTEVPQVLRRYEYAIYTTRETSTTLYLETDWRHRAPFDDEAEAGADFARSRFVVRARRAGAAFYTLRITAENQVHLEEVSDSVAMPALEGVPGWTTMPAPDMYEAYVAEIMTEIELKVDAGLRTHGAPIR